VSEPPRDVWSAIHEPRPTRVEIIEALLRAGAGVEAVCYPTGAEAIHEDQGDEADKRRAYRAHCTAMTFLQLVAIVVHDYEPAIRFFVDVLGFELAEDSPATATDGSPKRWVVVRPPGAQTGLLLARADGERQVTSVGQQHAGRVGFFLRVDDFAAQYERMVAAGVTFVRPPRIEPYGRVAVFLDVAGNRWDLLGPATP